MGLHQLLHGSHAEGAGDSYRRWNAKDPGPVVVESDRDLSSLFPEKFKPWHGAAPASAARAPAKAPKAPDYGLKEDAGVPPADADDLDSLTVAELRDLAESEEVVLSAHMRKDEIVAALKKHRGG